MVMRATSVRANAGSVSDVSPGAPSAPPGCAVETERWGRGYGRSSLLKETPKKVVDRHEQSQAVHRLQVGGSQLVEDWLSGWLRRGDLGCLPALPAVRKGEPHGRNSRSWGRGVLVPDRPSSDRGQRAAGTRRTSSWPSVPRRAPRDPSRAARTRPKPDYVPPGWQGHL